MLTLFLCAPHNRSDLGVYKSLFLSDMMIMITLQFALHHHHHRHPDQFQCGEMLTVSGNKDIKIHFLGSISHANGKVIGNILARMVKQQDRNIMRGPMNALFIQVVLHTSTTNWYWLTSRY